MSTRNRFAVLSQQMAKENAHGDDVFMSERISADSLWNAYQGGRAAIVENNDRITAIGVLWDTPHKDWFELGSLWVDPPLRGSGLAHQMYSERLKLLPEGKRCFVISHNPRVERLATAHGFTEANRDDWLLLAPYEVTCGPCDRKVDDKRCCPFRAVKNQCRLFVL